MNASTFVDFLLSHFPFTPTLPQEKAIKKFSDFIHAEDSNQLFVLKGFAGTGKTTLIGLWVQHLKKVGFRTVLMAPTGRAAKVMASYANHQAFTIHKRIYFAHLHKSGGVRFKLQKNKYRKTLFVVDEASMISDESQQSSLFENGSLLHDLIQYVNDGDKCKLLLVGDTAQLPPIKYDLSPALNTNVIELEHQKIVHEVTLNQVVRQAQDSGILYNATKVRNQLEANYSDPFQFTLHEFTDIIRLVDGHEIQDAIETAYREVGRQETAIIVRSNKRTNTYNKQIRSHILGNEDELTAGDLLMVVKNNYFWLSPSSVPGFIANGDLIEVLQIKAFKSLYGFRFAEVEVQLVDYPSEKPFETFLIIDTLTSDQHALSYEQGNNLYNEVRKDYAHLPKYKQYLKVKNNSFFNALQVKFSYTITCHKSQGGQWKRVFIEMPYLPDGVSPAYFRWLYTAITRASERLFLIGFKDDAFEQL